MQTTRNLSIISLITLVLVFSGGSQAFSAGTVTVEKSGNGKTILILGDAENNEIEITQPGAAAGLLEVTGYSGTAVLGSPVELDGVIRIIVRMRGGRDTVSIGEPLPPPSVSMDTPDIDWIVSGNAGQDYLGAGSFAARSLRVEGGYGNDFIFLDTVWVQEQSGADGGPGNHDEFYLGDVLWELIDGPFDLSGFEFIASGCFRGDMLVATETGLRPIRTIRVDDRVWSLDAFSGKKVLRKVNRTYRKLALGLRALQVGWETIFTTDGHPYWVEGKGWVEACRLHAGDTLYTDNGARLAVSSNQRVDPKSFYAGYDITKDQGALASLEQQVSLRFASFQPSESSRDRYGNGGVVYNLEVEDTHNFFVGKQRVLVHNK